MSNEKEIKFEAITNITLEETMATEQRSVSPYEE